MTPDELVNLPPSTIYGYSDIALAAGKPPSGPGFPLGALKDTDGTTIDGGDLYIEGSWNVELYGPLKDLYEESQGNKINPDVVLHKKWMYGSPQLDAFLQERGIKSLMFGGFNTEQCVWATMLEARSKRYDTIMLRDCCGTIDRKHAQETVEGHFEQFGGLILTGKELEKAFQQVA